MPPVLVIGIGNTLRRDDGLGWYAAERLMAALPAEQAEVIVCHQLNPELAENISRAGLVVFIDAAAGGGEPGQMNCRDAQPQAEKWGAFVHQLEPASLLGCARDLYGACPPAKVISVVGEDFELGEQLSEKVQRALEQVVAQAVELVGDRQRRTP